MFVTDKQTFSDLGIENNSSKNIVRFFNKSITDGGVDRVYDYFQKPFDDIQKISERQTAIFFLSNHCIDYLFDRYVTADLEKYIAMPNEPYSDSFILSYFETLPAKFSLEKRRKNFFIKRSICELAETIVRLHDFFSSIDIDANDIGVLKDLKQCFCALTQDIDMDELKLLSIKKLSRKREAKYDYIFRNSKRSIIRQIFSLLYDLDALNSIAKSFNQYNFSLPVFHLDDESDLISINQVYNPLLSNPVKNDVTISKSKNIWFLTGANMTGKSTLMKSIGISIYLAHIGFPVPAEKMSLSLFKGLLTIINLGDDITLGYSHFLNEVQRIKHIAENLQSQGNMIVMLDELFSGTNYQDAYEATSRLIESITNCQQSVFIISSHITELGEVLKKGEKVELKYLKTSLSEDRIMFTYKLESGLSKERLGIWLLEREHVFEMLKSIQ